MKRIPAAAVWAVSVALCYGAGLWMNPTAGTAMEYRGGSARFRQPALRSLPGASGTPLMRRMQQALTLPMAAGIAEWMRCLDAAGPADLAAAAQLLEDQQPRIRNEERRLLWTRWGEVDGPSAIASLTKNSKDEYLLAHVLSGWAGHDPRAAMEWVQKQDEKHHDLHSYTLRGALDGWAQRDLSGVTEYLFDPNRSLAFPPEDMAEVVTASVWNARGAEGVTGWIEALKTQPGCDDTFMKAVFNRARSLIIQSTDPVSSVAFLRSNLGKPWCDGDDVDRILRGTCDGQPERILQASMDLGPDPVTGRHYLLDYALTKWQARDSEAVATWLQSRAGSPVYDQAAASYATALASGNSADALRWAQSIQDGSLRRETIKHLPPALEKEP